LPHAADNFGAQELDVDKIYNFIRIRSAANQVTGPTFNERSVLAVKLPPGLFVPARTGEREKEIALLQLAKETSDVLYGRRDPQ
jgi:hypothetical protein